MGNIIIYLLIYNYCKYDHLNKLSLMARVQYKIYARVVEFTQGMHEHINLNPNNIIITKVH